MAAHRLWTRSGTFTFHGCAVLTPAAAYSTGQSAESVAHTKVSATPAAAPGRRRADGSRPSEKQITEKVVRANAMTKGHTPSHAHHRLVSEEGAWPTWRPRNMTPSTTPAAMNSRPSRCQGRWKSTYAPTIVSASASSPLC